MLSAGCQGAAGSAMRHLQQAQSNEGRAVLPTAPTNWDLLRLIDCWGRAEAVLEIYKTEPKDQRWNWGASGAVRPTQPCVWRRAAVSCDQTEPILKKLILAFHSNFISNFHLREHCSLGKVCLTSSCSAQCNHLVFSCLAANDKTSRKAPWLRPRGWKRHQGTCFLQENWLGETGKQRDPATFQAQSGEWGDGRVHPACLHSWALWDLCCLTDAIPSGVAVNCYILLLNLCSLTLFSLLLRCTEIYSMADIGLLPCALICLSLQTC